MARRSKLSRDQKRKKKVAERKHRQSAGEHHLQPYEGKKYKSEQYVDVMLATETGIHESDVMSDRKLTDWQVRDSLEYLVYQLRGHQAAPPADNPQVGLESGAPADLIAWRIRSNWDHLFSERPRLSNTDLEGILRTLLGSIKTWSRPRSDSRGYLMFLAGFLRKAGVSVQAVSPDALLESGEDEEELSGGEVLQEMGEAWLDTGDPNDFEEFFAEAEALLNEHQAGVVLEVCQWLIGNAEEPQFVQKKLQPLLEAAWKIEPPDGSPKRLT